MKNLPELQTELHQDMSLFWLQHSQFCSFSHHSAIRSKFQNNIVHCSSEISCNPGFTYGELLHDLFLLKIHYIRGHSQHSRWTTMMIPVSFFFLYSFVSKRLADFGLRKVHLWVLQITAIHKKLATTLIVPWHPTCRELWKVPTRTCKQDLTQLWKQTLLDWEFSSHF